MHNHLKLLQKHFPTLPFKTYKTIRRAQTHITYQLDDTYLFKFFKTTRYKRMIEQEQKLLASLRTHLVPEYRWNSERFAGYKLIGGKPLTRRRYGQLGNQKQVHKDIARFLTKLHTLRTPDYLPQQGMVAYLNKISRQLKAVRNDLEEDEYHFVKAFLTIFKQFKLPTQTVVHGNLTATSLLADRKLKGVVGFEHCTISDPAMDFSHLWDYGKDAVHAIYRYYEGPKDDNFIYRSKLYHLANSISSLYESERENDQRWNQALRHIKRFVKREMQFLNELLENYKMP